MVRKILLAFSSRRGSTAQVADAVASVLRDHGMEVEILPARKVRSLSGYDAVVLGTAIRAGKPLSDAVRFAARFGRELSGMPAALFVVCLTMIRDTPQSREKVGGYIEPLVAALRPRTTGLFAGAAERKRLGFLLGRFMEKILAGEGIAPADYRDWRKIRTWAGSLPEILQ